MYKSKFKDDIAIFNQLITEKEAKEILGEDIGSYATHHFGQRYLNSSTIAGLMRILIKKLREKYEID
ncbi:hypothetical protein [Anaerococcus ihuae]|uniref:hypothetical protein n=1 Tax=Anaerococcus ihuae TaxID=2899519 RepID=UPI001F16C567|nr:hypothetical protein [Anaerococcus ihuae]